MIVKMRTLLAIEQPLGKDMPSALFSLLSLRKIPATLVHQAALLSKSLRPHFEAHDKAKTALAEKHATPIEGQPGNFSFLVEKTDESGNKFTELNSQAVAKYNRELMELDDLDCEIMGPIVVPLASISDSDGNCLLNAREMLVLGGILEFVEAKK